jgi:predicted acylesterase/phospholipase RssA
MVSAIATEAAKGRLLLVATTEFDSGEPVIWDLGSIALHGDKSAKQLIQTLLLASASVPGMLPPVTVRFRSRGKIVTETHVDGGVTLPFFIAPTTEDLVQLAAASDGARHHRWAIVQRPAPNPCQRVFDLQPQSLRGTQLCDAHSTGIDSKGGAPARSLNRVRGHSVVLSVERRLRLRSEGAAFAL